MANGSIYIGTTGFNYLDWLGNFYPQFCPPADFLRCYNNVFSTVELDSTFYRIPDPGTVEKWARSTSANFRFAARFPQSVTHDGDLDSRIASSSNFLEVIKGLGDKLGPLLMQFPASFGLESHDTLCELLRQLPQGTRVAVEFRKADWLTTETFDLLKRRGVALCLTECPGLPRLSVRTADFAYCRLVGDRSQITEDFSHIRLSRSEELRFWVGVVETFAREDSETYAFFSNHFSGHAPTSALQFRGFFGNSSPKNR